MLDTLDFFINISNAFNVDTNYGIADRIENAINIIDKYLFDKNVYDDENDEESKKRYRYSVRYVNNSIYDNCTKTIYKNHYYGHSYTTVLEEIEEDTYLCGECDNDINNFILIEKKLLY